MLGVRSEDDDYSETESHLSENDADFNMIDYMDLKNKLKTANNEFFEDYLIDYKNDIEEVSDNDSQAQESVSHEALLKELQKMENKLKKLHDNGNKKNDSLEKKIGRSVLTV